MERRKLFDNLRQLIQAIENIGQAILLGLSFFGIYYLMYVPRQIYLLSIKRGLLLTLIYMVVSYLVLKASDGFRFGHNKMTEVFVSQVIGLLFADVIGYVELCLVAGALVDPGPMFVVYAVDLVVGLLCCYYFTAIYHHYHVPHDMLLIYGTEESLELKFKMDDRHDKYNITEIISAERSPQAIHQAIARHDAVILNDVAGIRRNDLLKYCYVNGVRTYVTPKISDVLLASAPKINLFDTPLCLVRSGGLTLTQRFAKRATDIVISLLALILFSPVMLIAAVAVKLQDGGPVLFRQDRVTRGGRIFSILKFRSMVVHSQGSYDMEMRAGEHDPRITKVGKVLRDTHLDELPQLINILRGEMSIVGPRPERVEHVQAYSREVAEWHVREKVKGGLTGYGQIFGRYNTSPVDKVKLDLYYIENYSLHLDFQLMFLTLRMILAKEEFSAFGDNQQDLIRRRQQLIAQYERFENDDEKES